MTRYPVCRIAEICLVLLLALSRPGLAETLSPDVASRYIAQMGDRAVAVLAQQGSSETRIAEFTRLMLDAIDFDAVATATLGRMARTVSPQDKREFTQLFAARLIDVAIDRFGNIQIVRFAVDAGRPQPNGDVKVHSVIERAGDQPLMVDWRVRLTDGNPKINDIEVEGYSLVIHYRGEFERGSVSSVPGLISKLKDLNQRSGSLSTVQRELK